MISREAHALEKSNQIKSNQSLNRQALELTIYTQRENSDTQTQNDRNNSKP
jgi:hypothetical protein